MAAEDERMHVYCLPDLRQKCWTECLEKDVCLIHGKEYGRSYLSGCLSPLSIWEVTLSGIVSGIRQYGRRRPDIYRYTHISLSFPHLSWCCFFPLCCKDFDHPILRFLSEGIIPYAAAHLLCFWVQVSSEYCQATILKPFFEIFYFCSFLLRFKYFCYVYISFGMFFAMTPIYVMYILSICCICVCVYIHTYIVYILKRQNKINIKKFYAYHTVQDNQKTK